MDTAELRHRIEAAVEYIGQKTTHVPAMGLILGSGLGNFADGLADAVTLDFAEIPGFPRTTVEGHAGALVLGSYQGAPVAALRGRVHYYEGLTQQETTIPVRVMRRLGCHTLLLTNAAGGINLEFSAGALMLISDHLNLSGQNPLIGPNLDEFGTRFPDMTDLYTKQLRQRIQREAEAAGIPLAEGVYAMYSGPNYETPAEIRAFRTLGADAVGMSTVPEAIVARHAGMRVIGISCITNMAAGVLDAPLSHQEVIETTQRVKDQFIQVVGMAIGAGTALPIRGPS